jgi:acyl-CoA thioesterase-1
MQRRVTFFNLFLFAAAGVLHATPDPFSKPFDNPVDKLGLPRVLIIGDSISIGYTPRVRKILDGRANVHRPKTNCKWSAFGDQKINEWISNEKWDLIHFNFGLWDWYGWSQDTKATPESYSKSLNNIVQKLKKSEATLVFAMTTPPCVGPEKKARITVSKARAQEFNQAALRVMKKHGVFVNDLYVLIENEREKYQLGKNNVHYNEAGRDLLATQVAKVIKEQLSQ